MIKNLTVSPSQRLLISILVLAIMLVTFITYLPALANGFVSLDDGGYVTINPHIRAWNWDNIQWMFTTFEMSNWHPLTWISYTLNYSWSGLDPWGYHLTNVIIHCMNTAWFFLLAFVLIPLCQENNHLNYPRFLAATLAALLLGIHPQHVESVAWVSERKDVLFLFFTLPTVLAYLFYTLTEQMRWYWIALGCFVLACLSKPMVVSVPFILILLDIYPLRRTLLLTSPLKTPVPYQKLILEKIPFLMLAIALAVVTFFAQQYKGAIVETDLTSIDERLINAANSVMMYLSRMIFPIFLSPYYPLSRDIPIFPVIAVLLGTVLVCYLWYRNKPYGLIIWSFYLITLLPVLGIIQVGSQAMADRYAYLPLLPFYLLIGAMMAYIDAQWFKGQWFSRMSMLVILAILGTPLFHLTQQQIPVWGSDFALWSQSLKYNSEDNSFAHSQIARIYLKLGDYPKAVFHVEKSLAINPELKNYVILANIYFKWEKPDEMLKVYQKMVQAGLEKAEGEIDVVFFNMAMLYRRQQDFAKAREFAEKTLKFNPEHADAKLLLKELNSVIPPNE